MGGLVSWQIVSTIQAVSSWSLTEPITGKLFRIKHSSISDRAAEFRGIISQAFDENNLITYLDVRRLAYKPDLEAFWFEAPAGLLNRKLAIRRIDNFVEPWEIAIEVLNGMPESISLPINLNEVNGLIEELSAKVSRLELAAHIEDTDNPHSVTAVQVGADPAGAGADAATSVISSHKAEGDPHSQYATDAQIGLLQTAIDSKVALTDSRLTNARIPTGAASGDLAGNYPNPTLKSSLFARSLGNPGWQKIYGGEIEEWGTSVVTLNAQGDGNITYPLAFPTNVFVPIAINGDIGASAYTFTVYSAPYSLSSFNFRVIPNPGAVTVRVNWIVKGI